MERKKRSKGSVWEFCYANKIFGTFGDEIKVVVEIYISTMFFLIFLRDSGLACNLRLLTLLPSRGIVMNYAGV